MASKELAIWLVLFNAFAGAFVASGTAAAWDIGGTPVPEEEIEEVQDSREAMNFSEIGSSGGWDGFDYV